MEEPGQLFGDCTVTQFFLTRTWIINNVNFYSAGIRHVVALMELLHYFVHQTHTKSC